ncbi:hypothetical protein [Chroococcidiopsis sp. CCMEE 29]|uniref:hypothetical protein n=1 Tax=Chroococcidiopsis sp. CCMEE 29 TaxID=155894 RepID=UPI0020216A7C|nr:hypothetical protein [Chroococcidiopsis sp. CCMEE 29]
MSRKFTILLLALTLCWTTIACGGPSETNPQARNVSAPVATSTQLSNGQYPVQQVEYNDADGEYTVFLLNTPPGKPPVIRTQNLQMARLTEEEIKAGQKSYLKVENGQPALYLTEDFKIEYVHNVTETQVNPQTGQQENVVVRRETGFWSPFAGALAGQAIGSLLFRPQYYVPPVYQPGVSVIRGYGGYGSSYNQAVDRYRTRYNAPPAAVRNRQNFRTTGRIRTPSYTRQPTVRTAPRINTGSRPSGSGYGTNTLRPSNRANPSRVRRPSSGSFGSGGRSFGSGRSGSRSFGSGARRR